MRLPFAIFSPFLHGSLGILSWVTFIVFGNASSGLDVDDYIFELGLNPTVQRCTSGLSVLLQSGVHETGRMGRPRVLPEEAMVLYSRPVTAPHPEGINPAEGDIPSERQNGPHAHL